VRTKRSRPLVVALEAWLREQRAKVSGQRNIGKAIAYSLTRWAARHSVDAWRVDQRADR
jgi:transposase